MEMRVDLRVIHFQAPVQNSLIVDRVNDFVVPSPRSLNEGPNSSCRLRLLQQKPPMLRISMILVSWEVLL